ncbi:MAG: hypothetical protein ACPGXL_05185 [Chitinophagales bacterium]
MIGYLNNSKPLEFQSDAQNAIEKQEKAIQVKNDFEQIQNFEGTIDEKIQLCDDYLLNHKGHQVRYDEITTEKRRKLTDEREDDKEGKQAMNEDTEEALLKYLTNRGKKGRHYHTVIKLLREKGLGITEESKNILDVVKDLTFQLEKSNADNKQIVTELVQKLATQVQQNSSTQNQKNRNFERVIFAIIIFILIAFLMQKIFV